MKRLGVLFLLLASGIPWAKGPSTAHFCVQHFSKSDNSYEMVIRLVGEAVPIENGNGPIRLRAAMLSGKTVLR